MPIHHHHVPLHATCTMYFSCRLTPASPCPCTICTIHVARLRRSFMYHFHACTPVRSFMPARYCIYHEARKVSRSLAKVQGWRKPNITRRIFMLPESADARDVPFIGLRHASKIYLYSYRVVNTARLSRVGHHTSMADCSLHAHSHTWRVMAPNMASRRRLSLRRRSSHASSGRQPHDVVIIIMDNSIPSRY